MAHLETTLTLHTEHVGVGCDRDTYRFAFDKKKTTLLRLASKPDFHFSALYSMMDFHFHFNCCSLASQRKMCGASSAAVELLPAKTNQTPWLDDLKVTIELKIKLN